MKALSPDALALKLLAELKKETDRGATLVTCRPVAAIQRALRFTDDEMDRAWRHLVPLAAVKGIDQGTERFAVLPTPAGLAILAAGDKAGKEDSRQRFDGRTKLYALIISLIGLVVALLSYFRSH